MKVMVKPYPNEAGPVPAPPVLDAGQQLVGLVGLPEDHGRGIIRLLQVTGADGSVHYVSAAGDAPGVGEEVGQLVEEAVEVTMVEGGDGQVLETEEGALDTLQADQLDTPSADEAVNGAVETESEVKPSVDQLSAQIQPVQCYVCGAAAAADSALVPLLTTTSRRSAAPLASLLASSLRRQLTVSEGDSVCELCCRLLNQCDRRDTLRLSAARHLRNMAAVGTGAARPALHSARRRAGVQRWEEQDCSLDNRLKLEDLTDLTVPSDTKRSARIAIRRNARVASAVHFSQRPRVLIDPELQAELVQRGGRPVRKYVHRMDPSQRSKGRRGRPKLPNLPENELPQMEVVEQDLPVEVVEEVLEPDRQQHELDPAPGVDVSVSEQRPSTPPPDPAREDPQSGAEPDLTNIEVLLSRMEAEDPGTDGELTEPCTDGELTEPCTDGELTEPCTDGELTEPCTDGELTEPCTDGEDVEPTPRLPTPGCPCVMCRELTQEEQGRLSVLLKEEEERGQRSAICQYCSLEVTGSSGSLRRHRRACRRLKYGWRKRSRKGYTKPIHECNTCQRTFRSARLRDEHCKREGHEMRRLCKICDRWFHPNFLQIHLASHSGAFFCKICNTHFSTAQTLKGHMYRHSGVKPFKCEHCPAAFRAPSSLFMHRRYHHSQERPYVCNFCDKTFAARATLRMHVRQHTGHRPFACQVCGKDYTRKSSLTQHLRSHTQERRHVCMTCGKRFDNKTYLKSHINRHLGIRAHVCGGCGHGFFSRPNLLKHMQVLCYRDYYREHGALPAEASRASAVRALPLHVAQTEDGLVEEVAEVDDDHVQTTEVILAIESVEEGRLLLGALGR